MLESPPVPGPASEDNDSDSDKVAERQPGAEAEKAAVTGRSRAARLLWWRHRQADQAAQKKRKKKKNKTDSAIRAARITQLTSLVAVIVTGVVAVLTSMYTSQSAADSVKQQIRSADARSREEFLTKEQEGAYTDYMNALNDLILRADVVSRILASTLPSDRPAVSSSNEWKDLHNAHQTATKAQIKINFLSSNKVTEETDKIGALLDKLEEPLMRFQTLEPAVEKDLILAEESFSKAARADLHADG